MADCMERDRGGSHSHANNMLRIISQKNVKSLSSCFFSVSTSQRRDFHYSGGGCTVMLFLKRNQPGHEVKEKKREREILRERKD